MYRRSVSGTPPYPDRTYQFGQLQPPQFGGLGFTEAQYIAAIGKQFEISHFNCTSTIS
jgi:hypothetical protein